MRNGIAGWELSIGFYPGVVVGVRTYKEKTFDEHVLYLPFVDLSLKVYFYVEDENEHN